MRREGLSDGTEVWWRAYQSVAFSSAFIVVCLLRDCFQVLCVFLTLFNQIRSIYRMISSIEGNTSTVATTEIYLYLLDVLPLMIAIGIYIPFWPGNYITGEDSIVSVSNPEEHKLSSIRTGSRELLAVKWR